MITFEHMKATARAEGECRVTIRGELLTARCDSDTGLMHYSYGTRGAGPTSLSPETVRDILSSASYPALVAAPANHGDLALQLCEARRLQREGCDTTATQAAIIDAYRQVA